MFCWNQSSHHLRPAAGRLVWYYRLQKQKILGHFLTFYQIKISRIFDSVFSPIFGRQARRRGSSRLCASSSTRRSRCCTCGKCADRARSRWCRAWMELVTRIYGYQFKKSASVVGAFPSSTTKTAQPVAVAAAAAHLEWAVLVDDVRHAADDDVMTSRHVKIQRRTPCGRRRRCPAGCPCRRGRRARSRRPWSRPCRGWCTRRCRARARTGSTRARRPRRSTEAIVMVSGSPSCQSKEKINDPKNWLQKIDCEMLQAQLQGLHKSARSRRQHNFICQKVNFKIIFRKSKEFTLIFSSDSYKKWCS